MAMTVRAFATEVNLSITVIERYKWTMTSSLNGTIPPFGFPGVFVVLGTGGGGTSSSLNITILDPLEWAGIFEGGGTGGGGILLSSSLKTAIFDGTGPDATRLDFPACLRVVPPAFLVSVTFSFTRVLRVPTSGYGV